MRPADVPFDSLESFQQHPKRRLTRNAALPNALIAGGSGMGPRKVSNIDKKQKSRNRLPRVAFSCGSLPRLSRKTNRCANIFMLKQHAGKVVLTCFSNVYFPQFGHFKHSEPTHSFILGYSCQAQMSSSPRVHVYPSIESSVYANIGATLVNIIGPPEHLLP